jgi:hypothetical protein
MKVRDNDVDRTDRQPKTRSCDVHETQITSNESNTPVTVYGRHIYPVAHLATMLNSEQHMPQKACPP